MFTKASFRNISDTITQPLFHNGTLFFPSPQSVQNIQENVNNCFGPVMQQYQTNVDCYQPPINFQKQQATNHQINHLMLPSPCPCGHPYWQEATHTSLWFPYYIVILGECAKCHNICGPLEPGCICPQQNCQYFQQGVNMNTMEHQISSNSYHSVDNSESVLSPPLTDNLRNYSAPDSPSVPCVRLISIVDLPNDVTNIQSKKETKHSKITKQEQLNRIPGGNSSAEALCQSTDTFLRAVLDSSVSSEKINNTESSNLDGLSNTKKLNPAVPIITRRQMKKKLAKLNKKSVSIAPKPSKTFSKQFNAKYFGKLPKREQQKLFDATNIVKKVKKQSAPLDEKINTEGISINSKKIMRDLKTNTINEEAVITSDGVEESLKQFETDAESDLLSDVDPSNKKQEDLSLNNEMQQNAFFELEILTSNPDLENFEYEQKSSLMDNESSTELEPNGNQTLVETKLESLIKINTFSTETDPEIVSSQTVEVEKSTRKRKKKNQKQRKKAAALKQETLMENGRVVKEFDEHLKEHSASPASPLNPCELKRLSDSYKDMHPVSFLVYMYTKTTNSALADSEFLQLILESIALSLKPCLDDDYKFDESENQRLSLSAAQIAGLIKQCQIEHKIWRFSNKDRFKYKFDERVSKFISNRRKCSYHTMEKRAQMFIQNRSTVEDWDSRYFYVAIKQRWDRCFVAPLFFLSLHTHDERLLKPLEKEFFDSLSELPDLDDSAG